MTKRYPAHVTDHAVVRYMERVLEIDVDAIRTMLLDQHDAKLRTACEAGASSITIEGIKYFMDKGKVCSVWVRDAGAVKGMSKQIRADQQKEKHHGD